MFYDEFGRIMMNAPVVGLDFTRYLPVIIVPYALLQVGGPAPSTLSMPRLTSHCLQSTPQSTLLIGKAQGQPCCQYLMSHSRWLQYRYLTSNLMAAADKNQPFSLMLSSGVEVS